MKNLFAIALAVLVLFASLCEAGRRGSCGGCGGGACCGGERISYAPTVYYYAQPAPVFYQPMPVGPVAPATPVLYTAPTAPWFHGCFGGCCGGQCIR